MNCVCGHCGCCHGSNYISNFSCDHCGCVAYNDVKTYPAHVCSSSTTSMICDICEVYLK